MTEEVRIFYITARQLTVYRWDGKELHAEQLFDIMADGQDIFAGYLAKVPDVISTVLVDVIEEEYRNETIPHVIGTDSKAVQQRKLAQVFRQTPYRACQLQGREKTGRKDDQVLLAALTNIETLGPWLQPIDKLRVPLAGIYSLPMLAAHFLRQLKIKSPYALLVTEQENRTLRQTFLLDDKLKMSRLVSFTRDSESNYASFLRTEIEKNQRYLNSLRLLPFDKPLEAHVVCHHSRIEQLREECQDDNTIQYHFIDINNAAEHVGLNKELDNSACDPLLIRLLASNRPAFNYANSAQRRYFIMHQSRKIIFAASIFIVAFSVLWSGLNMFNSLEYQQLEKEAYKHTQLTATSLEQKYKLLPKTPVSPTDMQSAVETNRTLKIIKTSPYLTMTAISKYLTKFPRLQLDTIQWMSSRNAKTEIGQEASDTEDEYQDEFVEESEGENTDLNDIPPASEVYQIALLEGKLTSFNGDYQQAFAVVNKFIDTLRNNPLFVEVTATAMPLNVNPNSTLKGVTGKNEQIQPAKFIIKTVLRVKNEKV